MYIINEANVFADYADGQYVILNHVNGEYYSLDTASSAVLRALLAGIPEEEIGDALTGLYGEAAGAGGAVSRFVKELLDLGIILPSGAAAEAPEEREEAMAGLRALPSGGAMPGLSCEVYTDVADLLMMDPIHEVDEGAGWPVRKE